MALLRLPASVLREVTLAGISNISQCQKPLPVGASASNIVMAILFVPSGRFFQVSLGEIFFPLQPKPLNSCLLVSWPFKSGLSKVNPSALTKLEKTKEQSVNESNTIRECFFTSGSKFGDVGWLLFS